jgi:hypothetical protein
VRTEMERHEIASHAYETAGLQILELAQTASCSVKSHDKSDIFSRIPGTRRRLYQFTAIDDCTRIRVLKIFDACNQRAAIQFIDDVLRRLYCASCQ